MVEQLYGFDDDEEGDYERWTINCWTDRGIAA